MAQALVLASVLAVAAVAAPAVALPAAVEADTGPEGGLVLATTLGLEGTVVQPSPAPASLVLEAPIGSTAGFSTETVAAAPDPLRAHAAASAKDRLAAALSPVPDTVEVELSPAWDPAEGIIASSGAPEALANGAWSQALRQWTAASPKLDAMWSFAMSLPNLLDCDDMGGHLCPSQWDDPDNRMPLGALPLSCHCQQQDWHPPQGAAPWSGTTRSLPREIGLPMDPSGKRFLVPKPDVPAIPAGGVLPAEASTGTPPLVRAELRVSWEDVRVGLVPPPVSSDASHGSAFRAVLLVAPGPAGASDGVSLQTGDLATGGSPEGGALAARLGVPAPGLSSSAAPALETASPRSAGMVGVVALLIAGALALLPLLYRLRSPDSVLSDSTRARVYERLSGCRSETAAELAAALGIARTTATYHLRLLAAQGLVGTQRVSRNRVYYRNGTGACPETRAAEALLRRRAARALLAIVAVHPRAPLRAIAACAGVSLSTTHWHLERFERAGLVHVVRTSRPFSYEVSAAALEVLAGPGLSPRAEPLA